MEELIKCPFCGEIGFDDEECCICKCDIYLHETFFD